jgi:hypothetical protein
MSLTNWLRQPTPQQVAATQLAAAERDLLVHLAMVEYSAAMAAMLSQRADRLSRYKERRPLNANTPAADTVQGELPC